MPNMELKDWLGIMGFALGIGNVGWQIFVHFDRKKRERSQDGREIEREKRDIKKRLEEKYLQIFRDHLGLGTWKAKAYEAQDAGLTPEEVVALLERVWVPYHKNPVGTQQEILDPMLNELRGRVLKGYVKGNSG